jgi:hypothetical protein
MKAAAKAARRLKRVITGLKVSSIKKVAQYPAGRFSSAAFQEGRSLLRGLLG